MNTRTVKLWVGKPELTGETCPECMFDSIATVMGQVNSGMPFFIWFCTRGCGRIEEPQ